MGLKQEIELALKAAMKAGDESRKRTFRLILTGVKLAEVESGRPLDDNAVLSVIQKEVKIRREAIEGAEQAHRDDLIAQTTEEIEILETFLPKQLSDDELNEMVNNAIKETNAAGIADTGKVMKILMPKIQGRAPGDRVSQVVRTILQDVA
jgi:uncharacterized protein YqeY